MTVSILTDTHPPPEEQLRAVSDDIWADARCRQLGVELDVFFSDDPVDIATAKQTCASCAVIAPCLERALVIGEPCGVWGGQLFVDGRVVANKRRRGRPPKHPRPEDQLPMVPVPAHLQRLIA